MLSCGMSFPLNVVTPKRLPLTSSGFQLYQPNFEPGVLFLVGVQLPLPLLHVGRGLLVAVVVKLIFSVTHLFGKIS